MKITIKEKSSMITKAIVFQLAMSIFGVMLASSLQAMSRGILIIAGIFSILFYFSLIGASLNEDGLKDNIKVTSGRVDRDPLLGLKYIAVSYVPSLVITVIFIVLRSFGMENAFVVLLNALIRLFLCGMYIGFDSVIFSTGDTPALISLNGWTFLVYQLISIGVCGLFYYIGLRGINLLPSKKESEEK